MSASAPHPPDPLEEAHLLYMRGDLAGARELLETILAANPDDRAAYALRDKVERELVEERGIAYEREASAEAGDEELNPPQVLGLAIFGVLLVVAGGLLAVWPIRLGLEKGFGTEIVGYYDSGIPRQGHYPIHLLLLGPLLLIAAGAVCLLRVYRQVRR